MRIHTDIITSGDVGNAVAIVPGAYAEVTQRRSQKRHHALEVKLSATDKGPGRRHVNTGKYGAATNDYALTWDEWGNVLAALFALDPNAIAGDYGGANDFHWKTGSRFAMGPVQTHHHRWEWENAATNTYSVSTCKGCGALKRTPVRAA